MTVGDRRRLFDERVARLGRRMSLGSLGGRSEQAQPPSVRVVAPSVARSQIEAAVFSVVGTMEVSTSSAYRVLRGGRLTFVYFTATAVGTGNTAYRVLLNGSALAPTSITVDDADLSDDTQLTGAVVASPGDLLRIDITAAGLHEGAAFQVLMVA